MCSMGFHPHIPGSCPCPRFRPHPRFHPHHLWSMTTLLLPLGGLLVGVVSMRGKGHWLGVGGVLEYTRNPESPPLQIDNPIFFFLPQTELVKFLSNFSYFFLTPFRFRKFCSKYGNFLPTCIFLPFFLLLGLCGLSPKGGALSQSAPGCVTRHTRHASVTHFRPISGNIVEVTLVTPPIMYINSHTK